MVSTEHPQFREIAISALPFTDHLVINEAESSRVLHRTVPADDTDGLVEAARELLGLGVRQSVTIHTEHGCVSCTTDGETATQSSVQLPDRFSKGATGAGDAFAAGLLYGLHEGLPLADRLRLAVCTAAVSLSDPTPSAGLRPVAECLELGGRFGFRW
jgi:sugar/nucleoside kinase (ribokinase family)